jgi:DNA polymerase elongation subunit (family B)
LQNEDDDIPDTGPVEGIHRGVIAVEHPTLNLRRCGLISCEIDVVETELDLINAFVDKVRTWDPEILAGFEIQNLSWGYLLERGQKYSEHHFRFPRYRDLLDFPVRRFRPCLRIR